MAYVALATGPSHGGHVPLSSGARSGHGALADDSNPLADDSNPLAALMSRLMTRRVRVETRMST
jgi:hypothetical protein